VQFHRTIGASLAIPLFLCTPGFAHAQSDAQPIALNVGAGRPLEVVVDKRVTVKHVGQPIEGTLVDPIYAYDRVVVPAGTTVLGHIASLEEPSTFSKTRAMIAGDFTPRRHVVLEFDTLVLDGSRVPIRTVVRTEIPHLKRTEAPQPSETEPSHSGVVGRAEQEAKAKVKEGIATARQTGRDVLAEITQPGKSERLKNELVQRLPYHPQFIDAGTGYQAELLEPLDFGRAAASDPAPPETKPAPSSLLRARLVTMLDSSTTPRGTAIQAVVTEPVFSSEHQLIFPEGTILTGEVTFATPARSLHRNGQLRFLFESVQVPAAADSSPLLASLHSVHASGDDRVSIDEEGGATLTDSKTRFIAPTLAILALRANLNQHDHLDPDGDGHVIHEGTPGALGVGGFIGAGVVGIPLSLMSRPVGIALSAIGAVRTTYSNVLGKGREVQFPAHTLIQLQLAPGPSPSPAP
jgi:hypothetical protein